MPTFTENIFTTFEVVHCGGCGISFALPDKWLADHRATGENFHCPNGCVRAYCETEASLLRKQLEAKEAELRAEKCEVLRQKQARAAVEAENVKVNRKLRRVHKGVCPCCKRSFENLKQHMMTQHPEKST